MKVKTRASAWHVQGHCGWNRVREKVVEEKIKGLHLVKICSSL